MVHCDTLVGWNGVARDGRFAPIQVSVESSGPRLDVEVQVEVEWDPGMRNLPYHRVLTRTVLLPAGATRRIPFVIPVRRDERSLRVRVLSRGVEIARDDVDLRSVGGPDRLVAAVAGDLSLDSLAGLSEPGSAVRVVYPRVDDLPESWAAYDGISTLVVHDTSFQQLRAAQVAAIERWVVSGGTVVFTGGADALAHAGAGFEGLLPVQVNGIRETAGLAGLGPFLGGRAPPRGRVMLALSTVVAGSVLASQDGIPLVVQHRLGAGSAWFIAFDPTLPPLDGWQGSLALWRRLSEGDRQPVLETAFLDPVDDPWIAPLLAEPAFPFPSIVAALLFLAGYFLLLFFLLAGRFSRRLGAPARALLLLGVSVLAGATGWLLFNRVMLRPSPSILEAGRVDVVSGDGQGMVSERLGLFATRAASCAITIDTPDVAVDEITANSAAPKGDLAGPAPLVVDVDRRTVLRDVSLGRFGSRMLAFRSVVPFALRAMLTGDDTAFRVTVVNDTDRALEGCFLVRDGRGYPIGGVAAGATTARDLSPADGLDVRARDAAARLCGDPRRVAFWSRAATDGGPDVVVGWLVGPLLAIDVRGARRPADRAPLTMVTVRPQ
jgi:hypothetical protein